jgi:cation diffusion facilitator CzcD-associated flavoprotein CzcO
MGSSTATRHRIVIIGAGSGGLCMGIALRRAGIDDFVILDKAAGVGGTWWYNTYPGAECDVQSHLYSFSFEPKPDWSRPYAGQAEILAYLGHCTDKYGLRPHLRLETAIASAEWQDARDLWRLTTTAGEVIEADAVVSAIGMFNNIVWPRIPGIADFTGASWHSARWDHGVDLTGKRIGVVGIAASAIQFAPRLAPLAASLHLFQRTANWVVPKNNEPYTPEQIAHFQAHPEAVAASRAQLFATWDALCTFQDKPLMRQIEASGLERIAEVRDPETRRKLTPNHPFGCKRPLFSDEYYPIFNRPNVELVTDDIECVTPRGILTRDGRTRELDVIVYSTGFETTTYLNAIEVTGRGGRSLADAWRDGAQAYVGVTTAGFPNLYMLYGPNTNQGCILYMLEQEVGYVMRQIERLERERLAWLDVRPEAMAAYNADLQEEIGRIDVWQAACGNDFYYRSASGRFVTNFPGTMTAYTQRTHAADAAAYEAKARA